LAAVPAWLQELPRRPAGAVMVPTAGNRLDSTPWVNATVALLEACGMTVRMLDLEAADPTETAAAVSATDLVWVTGGHPIFLLQHARASGFLDLVRTRVLNGELYYGGISAGAALATRDLATYRGALVTCYLLAHANRGRQQRYAQLIAAHPEREFATLTDDQALIVTGNSWRRTP
jgi:dipeptidase E